MKRQFPTKKEFVKWWDNKEDCNESLLRTYTCPIAKYLRAHGYENASVGAYGYCLNSDELTSCKKLPDWAFRFVRASDHMPKPYKGLPTGFK
jgi:hypothetical protein